MVGRIRGVSPEEEKIGYDGKDLQKRKVLSLEWKSEGVMAVSYTHLTLPTIYSV